MKTNGVIFDMDGLIIDSERFSYDMCEKIFEEMNVPFSGEMYMRTVGIAPADCDRILLEYLKGDTTKLDYLNDRYKEILHDAYKQGLVPLKKGAVELIQYLKENNIPYVLATSSPRERVNIIFDKTPFGYNPFEKIITGGEVAHGKPAPDIFLKAAEMIGQDIEKCIVLEDSFNGVRAGNSAGAVTIMVPDLKQPTEEIRALCNDVVEDLFVVIKMLKEN